MKSYGCKQIIVLIVPIGTHCGNEATLFSLFNAVQILSIPISENPSVVFIVLIVTLFLSEEMSFSLINATQILSIPIRENLAGVFIVLIVHSVTHCLNEAMPFSLFNATQILSIAIGKAQGINLAVVIIVLIVLIDTSMPAPRFVINNLSITQEEHT